VLSRPVVACAPAGVRATRSKRRDGRIAGFHMRDAADVDAANRLLPLRRDGMTSLRARIRSAAAAFDQRAAATAARTTMRCCLPMANQTGRLHARSRPPVAQRGGTSQAFRPPGSTAS
jgi:hypothetical protein